MRRQFVLVMVAVAFLVVLGIMVLIGVTQGDESDSDRYQPTPSVSES